MKNALEETQALLASIVNSSDDAILSKTLDGTISTWNSGAEKIFGYTAGEITGKHISILIPPDLRTEEIGIMQKIHSGESIEHYETIRIRKDGKPIPVSLTISPLKNYLGKITGASKILRDISFRKEAEEKLAEGERQYQRTLDNLLEGIQILDFNWRYTYVNDMLVKQSKYKREELIGYTFMDKYPGVEDTDLFRILRDCMEKRQVNLFENIFTFPDGTTEHFELSIQPVPEGLLILSMNITERKNAEKEIDELNKNLEYKVAKRTGELASANKELESFSYSVSHDLRAPLRAIHSYTKILEEDYLEILDEEGKKIIEVISRNSRTMGELIDDLLAFSRLGRKELNKKEIQMERMATEIAEELVAAYPKQQIQVSIQPLLPASGDQALIKQVWINLISNAVKYSGKKNPALIEIGSYQQENQNIYFIKDNGVGFDMHYYHKLFGVFQRLHSREEFEGTGVGLAMTQRIIQKHQGQVWAEAQINEGATFYFSLPLIQL